MRRIRPRAKIPGPTLYALTMKHRYRWVQLDEKQIAELKSEEGLVLNSWRILSVGLDGIQRLTVLIEQEVQPTDPYRGG